MKIFLIAFALVATVCLAGLLLSQAVKVLFTGESFPPQPVKQQAVYYKRVPATSPISP